MRNELAQAFNSYCRATVEELVQEKKKDELDRLYDKFNENTLESTNALIEFADLLYRHGINEDYNSSDEKSIDGVFLIHMSILLKNNLTMLELAQYGKETASNGLYKLALGGENEQR